jgi:O-antigen ligase
MAAPRRPTSWALLFGAVAIAVATLSRTVQILAFGILAVRALARTRGRTRALVAVALTAVALAVALTDNPIKTRVDATAAALGAQLRGEAFFDDRLVFWAANWEMVEEKPVLGHGDRTDTAYRIPYYDRIGYPGFHRPYEAHDMYLQLLVSGGVVALALFALWLGWWAKVARACERRYGGRMGRAATESLVVLCLAGLTQNAFQDAEVRYALTLLCTALALARGNQAP